MNNQLNSLALGYAGAILSAVTMLALGILGNFGLYLGAVEMMQQWHLSFSLSIVGIVSGTIEAAIISFVFMYIFGLIYNKFNK